MLRLHWILPTSTGQSATARLIVAVRHAAQPRSHPPTADALQHGTVREFRSCRSPLTPRGFVVGVTLNQIRR